MRVRVIASRISAMIAGQALERAVDGDVGRGLAQPAGELVARQHHVGDAAHHPVEQFDRQADGARARRSCPCASATVAATGAAGAFGARRERVDQALSSPAGMSSPASIAAIISPMRSMTASTALTSARVGVAAAGADVGQRVLGGVAQRLEAREFEEAAIAFDGVDEAEDGIEPRAVVGLGFPGDDLAAQRFEHFPALGHEIGNQIVHRRFGPALRCSRRLMPPRC